MSLVSVIVNRWCRSELDSRECLKMVFDDMGDIDAALGTPLPWTSPAMLRANARAFIGCVNDGGGSAQPADV
jgi:hypothetical protein